jgi:F-type H+-transporting ATPase subunit b
MALVGQEAQQSRQRWHESLLRERQVFFEELRAKAGMSILTTIRRILQDLADEDLEDRMVQVFTGLVRGIGDEQQELLRRSLDSGTPEITLRSAFELKPDQRQKILDAIGPHISKDVSFRYEISPSPLSGIELMSHGYKLAWSIGDHLSTLEEDFKRILKEEIPEGMPADAGHGEESR